MLISIQRKPHLRACLLVLQALETGQFTFTASTESPTEGSPTHHDRRAHALQVEDIHAGLRTARHFLIPLARLGKVEVGAVRLPRQGDKSRQQSGEPRLPRPRA